MENATILEQKINYCLYARKSTESEEKQILSIDSQIKEMTELAVKDNLNIVEIKRESHSAKASGQRPVFNEMIKEIGQGRFNGILTWAPDRLSRNAGDLGSLVDLMDEKILLHIKTYGQGFSNSPNEKFLLMILGSQAKLENDNKSINVKRGLRTKAEMGFWPAIAPTGYLNDKQNEQTGVVIIDPKRSAIIKQMFEKVAHEQWSGRKVFQWLKFDLDFKTSRGKPLSLANIYRLLKNSFYTGTFEYPANSGKFFKGKHQALISQELFDQVQKQITLERHVKYASKEFAFTKLIKCGSCGSGVTAQEKFKNLKDGTMNRYVYYGCTRSRDKICKAGYLREEDLLVQFFNLIDQADLNELGIKHQLELEIKRYRTFQSSVFSNDPKLKINPEVDTKNYAKYILQSGSTSEKRELLACLKSKVVLRDKKLELEDQI